MKSVRLFRIKITAVTVVTLNMAMIMLVSACSVSPTDTASQDSPRNPSGSGNHTVNVGQTKSNTTLNCVGSTTAHAPATVSALQRRLEPALPVTYTDITGREITITDTTRVLALDSYGTLATTIYALGLGEQLIGRDISTGVPELADLPLVTHNGHDLNGEAILNLNPSLVITDYSIGPLEVQLQLMGSGIPVVIMSDQRSRDQIVPQIEAVAEVLGVPELGQELATRVQDEIETAEVYVQSLLPTDRDDRLRMAFLYIRGNAGIYYWFGEDSGADDLINALGGIDVASEAGLRGMRPLNAEGLVRAEPDLLLMMSLGLESAGGVPGLLEIPGIAETHAGQSGCIVDMSDYQILSFGPQFGSTLEALAHAIYVEAVEP